MYEVFWDLNEDGEDPNAVPELFTGDDRWRDWKEPEDTTLTVRDDYDEGDEESKPFVTMTLVELCSQLVAKHVPLEEVEQCYPPVPEEVQIGIAFWSFPDNEEDVRLYSCLANANSDEFLYGRKLYGFKTVKDCVQVGFNLGATVCVSAEKVFHVGLTFGRKKILTCICTCTSTENWCSHVVAVCLHRIYSPKQVELRPPFSESIASLNKRQLQKFSQYIINDMSQPMLIAAQRLIDLLVSNIPNDINSTDGAPDPTSGSFVSEHTTWFLNDEILHDHIKKNLLKFSVPTLSVICDVTSTSQPVPLVTCEWNDLLRPFQECEPEGMWNLLTIVREMLRKSDENALHLLEVITEEILENDDIMLWWFNCNIEVQRECVKRIFRKSTGSSIKICTAAHSGALLCDEVVALWRLAVINPSISCDHKAAFKIKFNDWHDELISRVEKRTVMASKKFRILFRSDSENFVGFKPATEACDFDLYGYPSTCISSQTNSMCEHHSTATQLTKDNLSLNETARVNSCENSNLPEINDATVFINKPPNYCVSVNQNVSSEIAESGFSNPAARLENESCNSSGSSSDTQSRNENGDENDKLPAQTRLSPPDVNDAASVYKNYGCSKSTHQLKVGAETSNPVPLNDHCSSTSQIPTPITELVNLDAEWQTMFVKAQGLYVYGHVDEARALCAQLVDKFLLNPPNFIIYLPPPLVKGTRIITNQVCHQYSLLISDVLQNCFFLCCVLAECKDYYSHAFKIGLYGLEMPRHPASSKPVEVKIIHYAGEILNRLRNIKPLDIVLTNILQYKARLLRDGEYDIGGGSLLPFNLTLLIFDCLILHPSLSASKVTDEVLGFEASLAALSMKSKLSEREYPLLCEGMRRQRGDLTLKVLFRYKNNPTRLAIIMDKILDRDIYPILKDPMDMCWYQYKESKTVVFESMKKIAYKNQETQYVPPSANSQADNFCGQSNRMAKSTSHRVQFGQCTRASILRNDEIRSKKTMHMGPNRLNLATEAYSHYLFEMAKEIQSKICEEANNTFATNVPHRPLLMCAFQLSLYSLGLSNIITPNWCSRNHSPLVSWIAEHAVLIGTPATYYLLAAWKNLLTSSEVANMAKELSLSRDRTNLRVAAELVLSCLNDVGNLNLKEITQSIELCKESSDKMMESAMTNLENAAAKNRFISPEVLFYLAEYRSNLKDEVFALPSTVKHHEMCCYRIGLLAVQSLGLSGNDENYSKNHPFKSQILKFLQVSKSLGPDYTKQFCLTIHKNVRNPFILHATALEIKQFVNPAVFLAIVDKCQLLYTRFFYKKLSHIPEGEYVNFVETLGHAHGIFCLTSDGNNMFKECLLGIQTSKFCKKELLALLKTNLMC